MHQQSNVVLVHNLDQVSIEDLPSNTLHVHCNLFSTQFSAHLFFVYKCISLTHTSKCRYDKTFVQRTIEEDSINFQYVHHERSKRELW